MELKKSIMSALQEDIGNPDLSGIGDITTNLIIPQNAKGSGVIKAKQSGVLAGIKIVEQTFKTLDPKIKFKYIVKDGESFKKGDTICRFEGKLSAILTGERTALNFLARLSGIATLTNKFVDKVKGTKVKILDTRKTTPGLRELEKYAVKCGGGYNHRMGLWDRILIKDNHIKAVGGIKEAISKIKNQISPPEADQPQAENIQVEIEVKSLEELEQVLSKCQMLIGAKRKSRTFGNANPSRTTPTGRECQIDRIMLDNMSIKEIKSAVAKCKMLIGAKRKSRTFGNAKCCLEVSGGVNLNNVRQIAETGVDYISVGALTHSAPAIDFSLSII